MICEVGYYRFKTGIVIEELNTAVPTDFKSILDKNQNVPVIWTNNIDVVRCFDYDSVVCIDQNGNRRSFKDHPQYEKWKNEFSVDEFCSVFGFNWSLEEPTPSLVKDKHLIVEGVCNAQIQR